MSDTAVPIQLKAKDFKSDQEVRWCPGCGDYAILSAVQAFLPELGIPKENICFVSGIGCSSRFPYYRRRTGCTRFMDALQQSQPVSRHHAKTSRSGL